MSDHLLLGIDVGTTATKTLLIGEDGRIVASAEEGYPLITPGIGRCEQRPDDWWNAVVHTVRRVCCSPERARNVVGIALSTQGGTVLPVDAHFQPMSNAIVWSDARCAGDRPAFEEALGEDYIYRISGWRLNQGLPAMQLRRMRMDHPKLFDQAAYFLTVPDYICAKLTGQPVVDLSNAGINQLVDIRAERYDPFILEFLGVRESQLAKLMPSCSPIGTLTSEAAAALGLCKSVVVSAGCHDQYAVALGAGICKAGDAVIGTGTAWAVTALRDSADFDSKLSQSRSPVAGIWGTMVSISTGGVCLDWFRKNVAGLDGMPLDYGVLNDLVRERNEPGAGGLLFYPYFNGAVPPNPDSVSRATLLGLDLSHDRGHVVRAIMEGVACQTVWALHSLEARQSVQRLFLSGGAAKSAVWTQIIAEITGRPLHVPQVTELACVGAAIMAGVGCGLFRDCAEGVRRLVPKDRVLQPEAKQVRAYQRIYDRYCRRAKVLKAVYEED